MVTLSTDSEGRLHLEVEGIDKFWALKSQLTIPFEHVIGAEPAVEQTKGWFHGFKLPGSALPGGLTAGTFYKDGVKMFWDVHNPENAIAIYLSHESYQQLIVEVENPREAIMLINQRATGVEE